jgi:hypothetical protein
MDRQHQYKQLFWNKLRHLFAHFADFVSIAGFGYFHYRLLFKWLDVAFPARRF